MNKWVQKRTRWIDQLVQGVWEKMDLDDSQYQKFINTLKNKLKGMSDNGVFRDAYYKISTGEAPPHNMHAEMNIIGQAIKFPNEVMTKSTELHKSKFYDPQLGIVWSAIEVLWRKEEPITTSTVVSMLSRMGELDKIDGESYIQFIVSEVDTPKGFETFVKNVLDCSSLREMMDICSDVVLKANQESITDVEDFKFEVLEKLGQTYVSEDKTWVGIADLSDIILDDYKKAKELQEKGEITGLTSVSPDIDRKTGGWQNSDLIVIGARPGMGKTSYILQEMLINAKKGKASLFFSLEMSKKRIVQRLACIDLEIEYFKIAQGKMDEAEETRYFSWMRNTAPNLPIIIDDTPSINFRQVADRTMFHKKEHDIKAMYVDYLQLMSHPKKHITKAIEIVGPASQEMKAIAKRCDIPVIVLSQLSRNVETRGGSKRPTLSDLRESGQIEQDANVVGFLYRPEYYEITETEDGTSTKGLAELIVAKNRDGALFTEQLFFDAPYTSFKPKSESPNDTANQALDAYKSKRPSEDWEDEDDSDLQNSKLNFSNDDSNLINDCPF